MQRCYLKLCNAKGLHARAAAKLSNRVADFQSKIEVTYQGKTVTANSVIQLMLLATPFAGKIEITADGDDEITAITAIQELINAGFDEN